MSTYRESVFQGRRTCSATGKTVFDTKAEAEEVRERVMSFSRVKIEGKRIKHRAGRPALKRSYFCEYCEGWHLTSFETPNINHNKTKRTLSPEGKLKKFKY